MEAWFKLSKAQKQGIITNVARQKGLIEQVVEKDIWVTIVLDALFSIPGIGNYLVFKGGTSLSKGYNLIERFSEDIDFAIDRKFLGFAEENLSKNQVTKLRKTSSAFIKEKLAPQLLTRLLEMGIPEKEFKIACSVDGQQDTDPLPLYIEYMPVFGTHVYLADKVILEVSARSLMEPSEKRMIQSFVADIYKHGEFTGKPFEVSTVLPSRTFLEKIFLLHELFLLNELQPPRNRMSRHLYDIERLMDTTYASNALNNKELFEHIVAHRKALTPVRGITYDKHIPSKINILPSEKIIALWEKDYTQFIEHMVVGPKLSFSDLIERLTQLQRNIREITWQK